MITKDTVNFYKDIETGERRVNWTWHRMMHKTVQEWHHSCPTIRDDWGYNQDVSFSSS